MMAKPTKTLELHYPKIQFLIIPNYWMRLSRIWRVVQIKEGIHRGRRPFWSPKITLTSVPGFLGQRFNNLQRLHFWRHFDVIGSIICSRLHFWRHWFNMYTWHKIWSTKKRRVFRLLYDLYSFLYIWVERNLQLSIVLCKSTQEKSAPLVSHNYTTYSSYIALL